MRNCTEVLEGYHPAKTESVSTVALGVGFLLGMIFSFGPQIRNILRARSSRGISRRFAFCSGLMGCGMFTGAALLQRSKLGCCAEWGIAVCGKELVPLTSLGVQLICTSTVFFLVEVFAPTGVCLPAGTDDKPAAPGDGASAGPFTPLEAPRNWSDGRGPAMLYVAIFATVGGISAGFVLREPGERVDLLGRVVGASATGITLIQYLPQLATTWTLRSLGNFSRITLIIQSVGGIGFGMYLLGAGKQNLVTWLPPLVTGGFQVCLLVMSVCFRQDRTTADQGDPDSATPLLKASVNSV